jgi:titin
VYFQVELSDTNSNVFTRGGETSDVNTREVKVEKLTEGNRYFFKVFALNSVGASEPGLNIEPITVKLAFDPPSPVYNLAAHDVTKSSARITWSDPKSDGGSPVTGYYVERWSSWCWSKVNRKSVTQCELIMSDLVENETYEIRACAENEAGESGPSEQISFVAKDPFTVPGKPDAPEVETIDASGSASLTLRAPADDGGTPVTGYVIEIRRCTNTKWTQVAESDTCDVIVPQLPVEVEVEFRIAAVNKAGRGAPSDPSQPAKYSELKDYSVFSITASCIHVQVC